MLCHGTLGPCCGRPGPHTGGPDPIPGVRFAHVEVLDQTWRPEPYIQGSGTFPWGSGLPGDTSEYVTFSRHVAAPDPPMWWGQVLLLAQSSRPRLGRVMTKNTRMGTASLYSGKGYPSFRVPTVAPGPTSGADWRTAGGAKACTLPQHGLIGDWRVVLARLPTRLLSIHLQSRQLPYLSSWLTGPRSPRLVVSSGPLGAPHCRCTGLK
jgi:hypothetical protein